MANGIRGPVPKHSSEVIRRNEREIPIETLEIEGGTPEVPSLSIADVHPIAQEWYDSLSKSGQARYYEASDWQVARICAFMLDRLLKSTRPSPEMYKAIQSSFSDLLVTEGARRRVRLEIARTGKKESDPKEDAMNKAMAVYTEMFTTQS